MDNVESKIYSSLNNAIDEIKPNLLDRIIKAKEYTGKIKAEKKNFRHYRLASAAACIVLIAIGVLTYNNISFFSSNKTSSRGLSNGIVAQLNDYSNTPNNASLNESKDNTSVTSSNSASIGISNNFDTLIKQNSISAQATNSRKIIKSATVALETKAYDKSLSNFNILLAKYSGFIQNSNEQGSKTPDNSNSSRNATYTVRIPSNKLDEFLNSVGNIGTLMGKSIQGQDISQNYFDTDTRLKTLKSEETRVLEILNKTGNMADLLTVEQRLSDIQTQIEQLTGQMQQWDSLVELSTVTITINEVKEITITPPDNIGGKISSAFTNSIEALQSVCINIVIAIVSVLPFAIALGLIVLIIFLVIRFKRKVKIK